MLVARRTQSHPSLRMAPNGFPRWRAFLLVLGFLGLAFADLTVPAETLGYEELASTRFLAADGTLLYERPARAGGFATPVELARVSPFVVQATLAGEDANFRWHPGIDPIAVARAAWLNASAGRFAYGGSTLTQQLAKRLRPEPRDLGGKLREAWFALRLEHTLSKDELLAQYLNRAYYGRNATGIEAAAQRFFGKSAQDLDLAESVMLAALPRAPSAYDPARSPERLKRRTEHLLGLMVEQGFINEQMAAEARARHPELAPVPGPRHAPHVVDRLLVHVNETGDVATSIELALQERIERHLERHLLTIQRFGAEQAAVLVLDNEDARVVAMVGSRDYDDFTRNGAVNGTTSRRSAGSTLKPFLYAMAFESGDSPASRIFDEPRSFPGYMPRNSDGLSRGWVTLERALGSSLNVPAVALLERTGVADFAERLSMLGFARVDRSGRRHGLSLALGAAPVSLVELAGAYAALANDGLWRAPGLTQNSSQPVRVFRPSAAQSVTRVLANPRARQPEFGMETPLDLPFPVAAKTGTSSAYCDNWTVGFTREVTVAVWVGNFDGRPLRGALAMEGAAPLFEDAMLEAMRDRDPAPLLGEEAPFSTMDDANAEQTLRFASPNDGAHFVVDPLLPASTQRVLVRLATSRVLERAQRLEYRVDDGEWLASTSSTQFSVPLVPGQHRVVARAQDENGKLLAEASGVGFTVTRGTDEQIHD